MRAGVGLALAVVVGSAWYLLRAHPTLFASELNTALQFASNTWELFKPGGKLHPAYFLENQGHTAIEASLVAVIVLLYFQRRFKPKSRSNDPLTEKEVDELCAEWRPEPLAGSLPTNAPKWEPPVISSTCGLEIVANGKKALNMATYDYLALAGSSDIMAACERTINKYGVGACGPRGFYGTIDVHLHLEERVSRFLGTQSTILYSYDLATIPSVIPAFANRNDLIVCDEAVSYATQKGCNLSRAKVLYFKHNDMNDLERVLQGVLADDQKHRDRPLNRRFLVVEGIYINTGEMAPLRSLYELKERYRFRLILDESVSLGVLGATGRGAWEEAGLSVGDVDIIAASMGHALASVGGFCSGSVEVTEHQRLSGLGYCFSAALPPYLATAAIEAINVLDQDAPELLPLLRVKCQILRRALADIPGLQLVGPIDTATPLSHLRLATDVKQRGSEEELLHLIVDDALKREGVLFTVASYSALDKQRPPPSIKVTVTVAHEDSDLLRAAAALKSSVERVLKQTGMPVPKSPASALRSMSMRRK